MEGKEKKVHLPRYTDLNNYGQRLFLEPPGWVISDAPRVLTSKWTTQSSPPITFPIQNSTKAVHFSVKIMLSADF